MGGVMLKDEKGVIGGGFPAGLIKVDQKTLKEGKGQAGLPLRLMVLP